MAVAQVYSLPEKPRLDSANSSRVAWRVILNKTTFSNPAIMPGWRLKYREVIPLLFQARGTRENSLKSLPQIRIIRSTWDEIA
jgi:hypothetical protein